MKRLVIALILALIMVASTAAVALTADPQIADVQPNHWAYQAVKKLVSEGYLGLYADNTFRGNQPVDRFTLAVVVSRLLGDTVAGKISMNQEDADLLRKLTGEFRQELVALSLRTKDLEEALEKYERDRTAMGADMAVWKAETGEVRDELAKVLKEIIELKNRVAAVEEKLAEIESDVAALENAVAELEESSAAADEKYDAEIAKLNSELEVAKAEAEEAKKDARTWSIIAIVLAVAAGVLGILFP